MKHLKKLQLLLVALIVGSVPLVANIRVDADPLGNVTSYNIPGAGEWIVEASDGALWATNTGGQNGVVKISKSGSGAVYNTSPNQHNFSNLTAGSAGSVWLDSGTKIGLALSSGTISVFDKPTSQRAASHGVAVGPDGNIWFAQGDGDLASSRIGRMTPTGTFLSPYSIGGNPWWLVSDPANNAVWYSLRPINAPGQPNKIGKFEMDGTQTEFSVPSSFGFHILHMTLGPDGNIWFNSGAGKIGKMTPSGNFTIYDLGYTSTNGLFRITTGLDGNIWATRKNGTVTRISTGGSATNYTLFSPSTPYATVKGGLVAGSDGNIWVLGENGLQKLILKVGTGYTDNDEDGLQESQETSQGTSDSNPDTDGDGLSDYVESTSYGIRDQVFCNQAVTVCEYPEPTEKDIYIENDWMEKPGTDGYSMQLATNQVSLLQESFAVEGVNLHIDTGQLGGGAEVPYYSALHFAPQTGITDFYDYKLGGDGITSQMSILRRDIFHYLITGQSYADAPGSSGAAYAGDDDLFISFGEVKENFSYSSLDVAISGTVMHELGHGLCLTNGSTPAYAGQPASCRFSGVDVSAGPDYNSVMNYDYQLSQVDYSAGLNGAPNDHDDWGTIRMGDFTQSNAGDILHGDTVKKNHSFKYFKEKRNSKNERLIIGPKMAKLKSIHD